MHIDIYSRSERMSISKSAIEYCALRIITPISLSTYLKCNEAAQRGGEEFCDLILMRTLMGQNVDTQLRREDAFIYNLRICFVCFNIFINNLLCLAPTTN